MAPTPPNQSAGQSQAQPFAQDQRVTNALIWIGTVSAALCAGMVATMLRDYKEMSDNNVRTAVLITEISAKVRQLSDDQRDLNKSQNDQHLMVRELFARVRSLERRAGL